MMSIRTRGRSASPVKRRMELEETSRKTKLSGSERFLFFVRQQCQSGCTDVSGLSGRVPQRSVAGRDDPDPGANRRVAGERAQAWGERAFSCVGLKRHPW